MAKAYLCDRCQSYYEKKVDTENKLFLRRKSTHSNQLVDLCPECYESLNEWYKQEGAKLR